MSLRRSLVVTEQKVALFFEYPEYFGLVPWSEITEDIEQPNGREFLRLDTTLDVGDLATLDMIMSAEPQVVIGRDGGEQIALTFADDAAAALFRQRMREVLWGHGQTSWNDASR